MTLNQDELLTVVRRHSRFLKPGDPVPLDADLRELGVDSMRAIHLVVDIERTFQVQFPDDLLTRDTFRSAISLAAAVGALIQQRGDM